MPRRATSRTMFSPRNAMNSPRNGLSDKEIAATLGISCHTASNHVTAVRSKLGAPSRAAAAAIAQRDALV
ncbi:MAG: hypothetical protein H0T18_06345 [Chloroflexia bacterium]|nr:hypothetical protein [Chloroflexia bacterium]